MLKALGKVEKIDAFGEYFTNRINQQRNHDNEIAPGEMELWYIEENAVNVFSPFAAGRTFIPLQNLHSYRMHVESFLGHNNTDSSQHPLNHSTWKIVKTITPAFKSPKTDLINSRKESTAEEKVFKAPECPRSQEITITANPGSRTTGPRS